MSHEEPSFGGSPPGLNSALSDAQVTCRDGGDFVNKRKKQSFLVVAGEEVAMPSG
jgi:hypothetical protein